MKLTSQNIKYFLLGFFTYFVINTIMNWDQVKEDVNAGYEEGMSNSKK